MIGSVDPVLVSNLLLLSRPDTQIFTSFTAFLCTCTQFCWIWVNFLWRPIISSTWLLLISGISSTQVVWTAALNSSDSFSAPSSATLILTFTGEAPTTSGVLFLLEKMKLFSDHPNLILWCGFSDLSGGSWGVSGLVWILTVCVFVWVRVSESSFSCVQTSFPWVFLFFCLGFGLFIGQHKTSKGVNLSFRKLWCLFCVFSGISSTELVEKHQSKEKSQTPDSFSGSETPPRTKASLFLPRSLLLTFLYNDWQVD